MIPKRLLPQQVTYRPFLGAGPEGDVYGDPVTAPARVEHKNKLIRDRERQEVVSAATVYMRPDLAIPPGLGSQITLPGDPMTHIVIAASITVGARAPELLTVEVS